jgi:hypothetical protein
MIAMMTGEMMRGCGCECEFGLFWLAERNSGSIAVENAAQRGGTAEMEDGGGRWPS